MLPPKQSKKPEKPPSEKPSTEKPVPGSLKRKQPGRPPPEQPAEVGSRSQDHQQLPVDRSKQVASKATQTCPEQMQPGAEGKQHQESLLKEPAQSSSKGKQPVRHSSEEPVQAGSRSKDPQQLPLDKSKQADPKVAQNPPKQQVQSGAEGKQRQGPSPKQLAESKSKGKQPVRPTPEQQSSSRSENPQQLPLNKPTRANPETTKPHPKPQVQSESEDQQRQDPSPKQPAERKSKGKQPVRPAPEQPLQSSSRSENPQQLPLDKPTQANPAATKHRPKPQVQSHSEDQQHEDPQPETAAPRESKGKEPIPLLGFTFPKCFIARIPVKRGTAIKRVKVSIGPDTAVRHPQTFFFKNIPMLEPYWGEMNDQAFTATRILRLNNEEKPTPYFLMVCRGEYPEVISPRNKNGVFGGMDEPIFGDAFVFKLSRPELNADGYARYADIEKDIGSIDWLPQAIKIAARLVDVAKPHHANPGFPDMTNYASRKTMREDAEKLVRWNAIIAKVETKHATDLPVDEESGQPDLERMEDAVSKWEAIVHQMQEDGLLPDNEDSKLGNYQSVHDFECEVTGFQNAMRDFVTDAEGDERPSASTDITSLDPETFKFPQKFIDHFLAIQKSHPAMKDLASRIMQKRVLEVSRVKDPTGEIDLLAARFMVETMDSKVAIWRNGGIPLTGSNLKMMDELLAKARTVKQALELKKSRLEIHKAIIEVNKIHEFLHEEEVAAQALVAEVMAAALGGPAPKADEDGISDAKFKVLHVPDEKEIHITF